MCDMTCTAVEQVQVGGHTEQRGSQRMNELIANLSLPLLVGFLSACIARQRRDKPPMRACMRAVIGSAHRQVIAKLVLFMVYCSTCACACMS